MTNQALELSDLLFTKEINQGISIGVAGIQLVPTQLHSSDTKGSS
ncbi:hypothetical protein [Leeia sp.]